jgi:hypothetical protein
MSGIARITPVTNAVSTGTATSVFGSTSVLLTQTGSTQRTITVANTVSAASGGGQYGIPAGNASQATFILSNVTGSQIIVNKKPTDTITGHAEVSATGVANAGDA